MSAPGTLWVVATPIGNLGDVAPRTREVLEHAEVIAAEDTRRSAGLLTHLGLKRRLISLHQFNEDERLGQILEHLRQGRSVALVTDGGTPAISDPGYRLVAAAHAAGLPVAVGAGPCSVAAALSVAGFPADRFLFLGFLPPRGSARDRLLDRVGRSAETVVLFEAPHRLCTTLDLLAARCATRTAAVCRELTKLHEEVRRDTLEALAQHFRARQSVVGEIVLVIAAAAAPQRSQAGPDAALAPLVLAYVDALRCEQGDPRRAVARLARQGGGVRRELVAQLSALGLWDR